MERSRYIISKAESDKVKIQISEYRERGELIGLKSRIVPIIFTDQKTKVGKGTAISQSVGVG